MDNRALKWNVDVWFAVAIMSDEMKVKSGNVNETS